MAKGFWVKTSAGSIWKVATGLYVKVSPSTWQTINDAWVKVKQSGTDSWQRFWESATNPVTPIEILTSFTTTTEQLRLQGKNYRWTPNPSTLFYTFSYVDNSNNTTYSLTSSTSTSNPSSGSSITVPSSTTYRSISRNASDNEFAVGGISTYKFTVTGTTSSGASSVQTAEYSMRTPAAPTVTTEILSGTSVRLTITAASTADFSSTYRYIVYTSDAIGGLIESGGGRGGYAATSDPTTVTLTGLTAGRTYDVYVAPFTGSTGSTTANAAGYPGAEGYISVQPVSDYTFTFGKVLHVGTNGYISLDSGNTNDAISSTTGKVLGIFPGDLYQDTTTSVWYWSDETKFIIRWEGYHYNQTSNLRQYEVTFTKDTNYVTVYPINVANTTEGTEAYVKNGVALTSYAAALGTGSWRTVYFDPTISPTNLSGPYVPKSKSVMKQVTGLTAGNQDQGYTSITTSINQNQVPTLGAFDISSFTKGVVSSSSQGASRSTALSWGSSTNATRYEIQYQGSNDNTNWTTVQTYAQSAYNTGTSESKTWSSSGGDFTFYTFMRANIRASESTATAAYVYSNSSAYVNASGTAPGTPSFGTIVKGTTTASVPFTVGTAGTNYLYSSIEYMYRTSAGSYPSTWSTSTITNGAGTISLTGLTANTTYYIKIRTRNYDELYSQESETNFTTNAAVGISSVTYNGSGTITVNASGGGPYWQMYWSPNSTAPTSSYYDAASTTTTITDSLTPVTSASYWFYVRSSTQNLGNTTSSGNATAGTYSDYSAAYIMRHITFNFNGGSDTNYSGFYPDGTTNVPVPTPTARTGYTFDGWYDATTGGTRLIPTNTTTYTLSSTLTVYARWIPNTYAVTYYDNGGTGSPAADTKTHGTTLTLSSTTPTRTNYAFNGWNTNSNGTGTNYSAGGAYTGNAALDLYAKWAALYTITFDSKGGTAVSSIEQSSSGGSIAKPSDPTKTDYTFGGWTTTDGGTTAVTWPRTPTGNETLYAKWTSTAVAPSAPAAPTVGTLSYAHDSADLATTLTRVSNTAKNQAWTYTAEVGFPLTWVKPSGATDFEIYTNSTGTAPASSTSGNSTTSTGDTTTYTHWTTQSNRGTITRYFWVKAKNATGSSGWSPASTAKTSVATVVSGLSILIYRGNGTSSNPPSPTPPANTALSYSWTGLANRGNPNGTPAGEGHYATVDNLNIAGTDDYATSETV
jgi:uncharacterized repeat protein (TIGR02543 family)